MHFSRYVAIGDSFTEGMGDDLPDGSPRGWADLVALGLALSSSEPVSYANLAIRGRLLAPIVTGQMDAAIALGPDLVSINGGGNDIMRPSVSIPGIASHLIDAVDRAVASGAHVVLASGANPTDHIPLGARIGARGDALAEAVLAHLPKQNVTWVDNWGDTELRALRYWSTDRLHLNTLGHRRVAARVLAALEVPVPDFGPEPDEPRRPRTAEYWRDYVLPWIGRRLTGKSSGDAREPKRPELLPLP
ncbi:lysophospholipase L1-like esterase [Microbacteriaceae bacterium SG_E_30_P1]|uniref:Lysophospholipase L1-like esterase n=1 Tax=Antiquaquibacter oligotrophicus TaxID=2880260 RepID=A0ABT6KJS1_9MICO|nr:SGNH/GDSL hydrolase family protein [Antiquaquibacter oligotrophicus]MDH6180185.1 lysophospholipase L1-like esterase [Antiquaquibacter oligotrophicus]UDF14064.1 SGNH/GDSL hydrolase family protein [Antiquaquibacter oligotrophicus]